MELGKGLAIDFGELAQENPDLLLVAASEIVEAAKVHGVELPQFAGANALGAAVSAEAEPAAPSTEPEAEAEPAAPSTKSEAEANILDRLTAEQRKKAAKLTAAMAEKFCVPAEDFSVLRTTAEDGSEQLTVAYIAQNGIDLGNPKSVSDERRSWSSIFGKNAGENFAVTVGSKKYDTRTGMTEAAYYAFIADAKARGIYPLPDSPQLRDRGGVWSDTWLTGEVADYLRHSLVAYVDADGHVSRVWDGRGDQLMRRFRPAVVLR